MSNPLEMHSFHARDRAAWRAWLQEHHRAEPAGVWLVYYKPHTGRPGIDYESSVEEALCFGWIDSLIRRLDDDRYARKFTPRQPESHWSESNRQRVARLLEQGLMQDAGLKAVEAARASGRWDEDGRPEVDLEPAPELLEALAASAAATAHFGRLTAAQRQQFITWVNLARRPETRRRRVAESIALLERGEKLGMR